MNNRYLSESGLSYYTQKLKTLLDTLLATKADTSDITYVEGLISSLEAVVNTKASSSDLTREASIRSSADADLQAAIDSINTNKIINLNATARILPASEVAKIRGNGVLLIDSASNGQLPAETFTSVVIDNATYSYALTLYEGEVYQSNPIVQGESLNLFYTSYTLPGRSEFNDMRAMLTAYQSDEIASTSSVTAVADSVTALANNTYRKTDVYTKNETDSAITAAIGGVTQIRFEIVQSLPQVGENGVIYLIEYSQSPQGNIYQEWIWLASSETYETLGSTNQIDLTNYVTFDDLHALTALEVQAIIERVFTPVTEPVTEPEENNEEEE